MKLISSEQIDALNAQSSSGKLVEAVVFVTDIDNPDTSKEYYVRHSKPISFEGNQYTPLDMAFSGQKLTSGMELPTNQVTIANTGGRALEYIENNDIDIEGNDVYLQILFIDKFGRISLVDETRYQAELMTGDYYTALTFHLGVNYSLNDTIPPETMEKQEYPGIKDDAIRVGT